MIAALLNQKGRIGNTMLALHPTGSYGREGKRVILIDADCQGSALDWSEQRTKGPKLLNIIGVPRDTLHPGAPALARNANHLTIDGALMRSALRAADLVLIPVQSWPFGGCASAQMLRLMRRSAALWSNFSRALRAQSLHRPHAHRTRDSGNPRITSGRHSPQPPVSVSFASTPRGLSASLWNWNSTARTAAREIPALARDVGVFGR